MSKINNADLNKLLAKSNPEKTIREHTDDLLNSLEILNNLGYIKDNHLYELCKIACEFHDYGKVNNEFQTRIKTFAKFDSTKEIAHNLLSTYFINSDLFENKDDYSIVINAVLNHHNHQDNMGFLENNKALILEKLSDYDVNKIKSSVIKKVKEVKSTPSAIFVQGILYRCDYSASGEIEVEFPNDFLENSLDNLFKNWENASLNELQKYCQNHKDENIIITAPTGMGKTEASLFWLGNNKGFYILPLKTAINSMFFRICNDILKKENIDNRLALIHSDNLSVLANFENELDVFDYINLSKNFSLPITICTPDQIFNFVFKYPSYELKLATLAYSKIIIDEIQAYNAELLAYIINGIHQIIKMGGKVGIFTATLAPYILHMLNLPYAENNSPFLSADFSSSNAKLRHNVKIINTEIDIVVITKKFNNNKILVVCNTVKKAQEVYKNLCEEIGEENVNLLHAKFTKMDRSIKEKEILYDGKTEINKSTIWVSNQIVEASLDIDFDVLFTELSELSGLFQRMGRCNRKGVKSITDYNCFVFTEISESLLVSNYDKSRGFIDKDIYNLSKKALGNIDGIMSEELKRELLEENFTYENLKNSPFVKEYQKVYDKIDNLFIGSSEIKDVDKRFRKISTRTIIPENVYNENYDKIHNALKSLNNKNTTNYKQNILIKQKAKNIIEEFCLGVNIWDVNNSDIVGEIKLNKFSKIEVVNCNYDNKLGFYKGDKETNPGNGLFL